MSVLADGEGCPEPRCKAIGPHPMHTDFAGWEAPNTVEQAVYAERKSKAKRKKPDAKGVHDDLVDMAKRGGAAAEAERAAEETLDGHRHGETYEAEFDYERLNAQCRRVYAVLSDGQWHYLAEIAQRTDDPEASISARIRDLRKAEFGGHEVERERVDEASGTFRYRLAVRRLRAVV